jgi:hypothetical protein
MVPDENPIVAMANKIRTRRRVEGAIDAGATSSAEATEAPQNQDAAAQLQALGKALQAGIKLLDAVVGKGAVVFVRLERPLRLRVRFGEKRIGLDLDEARQLVVVTGEELDGEYQFDTGATVPALINLSKLSTEAGYGDALTSSTLLKHLVRDAELPRPLHLDAQGPMRF